MQAFPEELRVPPKPVVHIIGMESAHQAVLAAFNADNEKCKFLLKVISSDTKYPPKKPKHDYDHYNPPGILKDNWMKKHKLVMPAVVVLLHDLSSVEFEHTKQTVSDKVEQLRANFNGHSFKIAVVLVMTQDTPQIDKLGETVRKGLDGDSKTVFVLNLTPSGTLTSLQRLEQVLFDLCMVYYKDEGRRVKKYKEKLNKLNQGHLLARHNFKIAYYAEFRNDLQGCLKYYQLAYMYLTEIQRSGAMEPEVKVVAGFVNFRMCVLYAQSHHHLEAVDQFQNHMHLYRIARPMHYGQAPHNSAKPSQKLPFLHHAWVCNQHHMMAELLEIFPCAIVGTHSNRLMHSGFYFGVAACHARLWRECVKDALRELVSHMPSTVTQPSVLFVGQLPFAPSENDLVWYFLEKRDSMLHETVLGLLERSHKFYLQRARKTAESTTNSNALPSNPAVVLHKHNRVIAAQIAEEYVEQGDFRNAKVLLDRIADAFREDGWPNLLTRTLRQARVCAFELREVSDFVRYSLELCSPQLGLDSWGRADMLNQTLELLAKLPELAGRDDADPFEPLSGVDVGERRNKTGTSPVAPSPNTAPKVAFTTQSTATATTAGDETTAQTAKKSVGNLRRKSERVANSALVRADVHKDHPFVTCRLRFNSESCHIHEMLSFHVHLRVVAPRGITFNCLLLAFNDPSLDVCLSHREGLQQEAFPLTIFERTEADGPQEFEADLSFHPEKERVFNFTFSSPQSVFLECTHVVLCTTPVTPDKSNSCVGVVARDNHEGHALALVWRGTERSRARSWMQLPTLPIGTTTNTNTNTTSTPILVEWEALGSARREISSISVVVPEPRVSVELKHKPPPLLGEWFQATVVVNANTDELRDGSVIIEGASANPLSLQNSNSITTDNDNNNSLVFGGGGNSSSSVMAVVAGFDSAGKGIPIPNGCFPLPKLMGPGCVHHVTVWVQSFVIGEQTLSVKVQYKSAVGSEMTIHEPFSLTFVSPFKLFSAIHTPYSPLPPPPGFQHSSRDSILDSSSTTTPSNLDDTLAPFNGSSTQQQQQVFNAPFAATGGGNEENCVWLHTNEVATLVGHVDTDTPHRLNVLECTVSLNTMNSVPVAHLHSQETFTNTNPLSVMAAGDRQSYVFVFEPVTECVPHVLGTVTILWARDDESLRDFANADGTFTTHSSPTTGFPQHFRSTFPLPTAAFQNASIRARYSCNRKPSPPSSTTTTAQPTKEQTSDSLVTVCVGQTISSTLVVENTTAVPHHVSVTVQDSEAFLFAGPCMSHIMVPPRMEVECGFDLVPIRSGTHNTPLIQIISPTLKQSIMPPNPPKVLVLPSEIVA